MIRWIFHILLALAIIALFYFTRLTPVKDQLSPDYKRKYLFMEKIFGPIIKFLQKFIKPVPIGPNILFDNSHIILLIIIIVLLTMF